MTTVRSAIAGGQSGTAQELRQAAHKADRRRRAERGQVVVIHLVTKPGVAELVQSDELVETDRAAIRHDEAVERHREPALTKRLHGPGFTQHAGPGGNDDELAAMRVDRVCDEAVHRCCHVTIEAVDQNGVDDGALEEPVHWTIAANRLG